MASQRNLFKSKSTHWITMMLASALSIGCQTKPTYPDQPLAPLNLPEQWDLHSDLDSDLYPDSYLGPTSTTFESTTQTDLQPQIEHWWQTFNDPTLNQLISLALANNFTLRSAFSRLDQAKAIARQTGSQQSFTLDGKMGGSKSWSENNNVNTNATSWSLGLEAAYEVDLWGRVQNAVEASEIDVLATQQAINTAAVSLSAEVADTYFRWQLTQGQLSLINQQIHNNQNILNLLQKRFNQGNAQAADVLSQEQLLKATQSERIDTQSDLSLIQTELAILLGLAHAQAHLPTATDNVSSNPLTLHGLLKQSVQQSENIATIQNSQSEPQTTFSQDTAYQKLGTPLPPMPHAGIPSDLVQRRPDVIQAWHNVTAADRRVAEAIANQYPQLSLSASATTADNDVRDLFENWAINLAANLTAPLIDGGDRENQVRLREAQLEEAIHDYAQTVIQAVSEVQDALNQEYWQHQAIHKLDERLTLSKKLIQARQNSYLNGASDYLDVLDSLDNNQTLARTRLSAQQDLLRNRVNLYRALAGEFSFDRPEPLTINP